MAVGHATECIHCRETQKDNKKNHSSTKSGLRLACKRRFHVKLVMAGVPDVNHHVCAILDRRVVNGAAVALKYDIHGRFVRFDGTFQSLKFVAFG
jgi:hypothetical protein